MNTRRTDRADISAATQTINYFISARHAQLFRYHSINIDKDSLRDTKRDNVPMTTSKCEALKLHTLRNDWNFPWKADAARYFFKIFAGRTDNRNVISVAVFVFAVAIHTFGPPRITLTWHGIHPNAGHPNADSATGSYARSSFTTLIFLLTALRP